jgi:hypothetical protein
MRGLDRLFAARRRKLALPAMDRKPKSECEFHRAQVRRIDLQFLPAAGVGHPKKAKFCSFGAPVAFRTPRAQGGALDE